MHENEIIKMIETIRNDVDNIWTRNNHELNVVENKLCALKEEVLREQKEMMWQLEKDEKIRTEVELAESSDGSTELPYQKGGK